MASVALIVIESQRDDDWCCTCWGWFLKNCCCPCWGWIIKKCKQFERKIKFWYTKYRRPIVIFMSLIFLGLNFLAYQAPYYYLNSLTRPAQTVTVSSEGPAAEKYPDSMGQYNIIRDVYRYDRSVYKHVDREDRFIIFTGIQVIIEKDLITIPI